jgi:hypothetical protein
MEDEVLYTILLILWRWWRASGSFSLIRRDAVAARLPRVSIFILSSWRGRGQFSTASDIFITYQQMCREISE